jgi:nicotinic acid mononucleotide adenylyltransferase
VIGQPRFHRWRHSQRLVYPAEIVICEVQGTRGFQVVQRTRENLIHREFENTRRRRFLTSQLPVIRVTDALCAVLA